MQPSFGTFVSAPARRPECASVLQGATTAARQDFVSTARVGPPQSPAWKDGPACVRRCRTPESFLSTTSRTAGHRFWTTKSRVRMRTLPSRSRVSRCSPACQWCHWKQRRSRVSRCSPACQCAIGTIQTNTHQASAWTPEQEEATPPATETPSRWLLEALLLSHRRNTGHLLLQPSVLHSGDLTAAALWDKRRRK